MKVALVVNPRAGRLRGAATGRQAARLMADDGWRVELIETKAPGEAGELAREAAASGYELVVGVGGDGTLSELLNGLLGTGVPCGIIPCGTGNDFASFVGLSGNLGTAVRQLLDGSPRRIDMGPSARRCASCWTAHPGALTWDASLVARGISSTLSGWASTLASPNASTAADV